LMCRPNSSTMGRGQIPAHSKTWEPEQCLIPAPLRRSISRSGICERGQRGEWYRQLMCRLQTWECGERGVDSSRAKVAICGELAVLQLEGEEVCCADRRCFLRREGKHRKLVHCAAGFCPEIGD